MKASLIISLLLVLSVPLFPQSSNMEDEDWTYFITSKESYPHIKIGNRLHMAHQSDLARNEIPANSRTNKYIRYGNGCFLISLESDRIYKFSNAPFKPFFDNNRCINISYYDFGNRSWNEKVGNYFNVGGTPVKCSIEITSNNVTEEKRGNSVYYTFTNEGTASFLVTLGEITQQIDIQVISLPIQRFISVDTLIETIGFPDKDIVDGVRWPDGNYLYGFYISPSAREGSIYKHFYFFRRYPYLVLSSSDGRIDGISYMPISN